MTTEAQRMRMIELSNQGLNAPQVAKKLGCSVWTVRKWKQRFKKKQIYNRLWDGLKKAVYLAFFQ